MLNFNNFFENFDDLFSFSNNNSANWEELKKTGTVKETIEEKPGFKIITKTYKSNDGSIVISETITEPIKNKNEDKIKELNKQIKEAISKEEYEKAAELKKQRDKILNNG